MRVAHPWLGLGAGLFLTVAACGDDGVSPTPRHSSTTTQMGLQLTLSTATETFGLSDVVDIRAVVENVTASPVVLDFDRGDPPRFFNFNVHVLDTDDTGSQVYAAGLETLEERTLQPGESHTLEFPWDQIQRNTTVPADRGIYRVYVNSSLESATELRFADLFIQLE